MFNMLTVAVLLPIEVAFGVLYNFSDAVKPQVVEKDNKWEVREVKGLGCVGLGVQK